MKPDIRRAAAQYYDSNPGIPSDIPFYRDLISSPDVSILELGCGTGRVTLPLASYCRFIQGIDKSAAMLSIGRRKLHAAGIPPSKARMKKGDIADFNLGRKFELIIAPFRVFQNLETDAEVDGLFRCIRRHLAPGGTCVLNVFRPLLDPEDLRKKWSVAAEELSWEIPIEGGRLACFDRRGHIDADRLILYPELIYRKYEVQSMVEENILKIAMRCYYPDDFADLILRHGFEILSRWGGYAGEVYGQGPELVIRFREAS